MNQSISNSVLQMILAQANKDQNQHYPPTVWESHYQLMTNWLLDESVKLYPATKSVIDLAKPYFRKQLVRVVNGVVPFPKDYRNLLGFGLYLKEQDDNLCIPTELNNLKSTPTQKQILAAIAQSQSRSYDLTEVSIGRWNKLTQHRYKYPTLEEPIACIFDNEGIKICPYDVPVVEIRYIVKTPDYHYGYLENDDCTYYFDPDTTVEALWEENAVSSLFKAGNILYSNYVRDPEGSASAKDLRDAGLF